MDPAKLSAHIEQHRRRSVDVGGLALSLLDHTSGQGWGGWEERDKGEVRYAELLSEMYSHTQTTVNAPHPEFSATSLPSHDTLDVLAESLDSWNFEPHKLSDEDATSAAIILFETIFQIEGLQDDAGISLLQISEFLHHLRTIYRWQNSYHNFQHALDVLQAMHMFLCSAGRTPPVSILLKDGHATTKWSPLPGTVAQYVACIRNSDLLVLFIAAIGHDVGHPGFTNVFMKNAKAPLSTVYDDQSALEHMHYALLTQIMRHNGLSHILDRPDGGCQAKKLLADVVLATDMSVHFKFMQDFANMVEGHNLDDMRKVTLVCQALIKCADISNPSRPQTVSQHWAEALSDEWTSQENLEKHFQLPTTVSPAKDALSTAKSQIFFISTFAKPLLDLTCKAIPQLSQFAEQCTSNLNMWISRSGELQFTPVIDISNLPPPSLASGCRSPEDFASAFPPTLPIYMFSVADESAIWSPLSTSGLEKIDSICTLPSTIHTPKLSFLTRTQLTESTGSSTPPISPTDSAGSSSYVSPRSDVFSFNTPSCTGSTFPAPTEASVAIRAAYQAGVRKKKSMRRMSWDPSGASAESRMDLLYKLTT